jgi:hypothetical protein
MDTPDVDAVAQGERALRRRLHELEETQRWVHHVGDLGSGAVSTAVLDRPLAPLSRAERLSRLGRPIDPSIFAGPAFRLTARQPYQASPEAWIRASHPVLYATHSGGFIIWSTARDVGPGNDPDSLHAVFAESPVGRSLVTFRLSGVAWPGNLSHVLIASSVGPASVSIPIEDTFADHTIDLTIFPQGGQVEVFMFVFDGLRDLLFHSLDFRHAPVLDPVID